MDILEWCNFFSQHYNGLSVPFYLINNVHTSALGSPHTPTAQGAWQVAGQSQTARWWLYTSTMGSSTRWIISGGSGAGCREMTSNRGS